MNSMLPPSRQRRAMQLLLWSVAVVGGLVVIYVAIQAILAPWTKTAPPSSPLLPAPLAYSVPITLTRAHDAHASGMLSGPTGRLDADLAQPMPTESQLKNRIEQASRQLDADIRYDKAQRVAVAKARLQAVSDKGQEVLRRIDTLQSEVDRWNTTTSALLAGDEGKLIAGSRVQLEAFDALFNEERPPKEAVLALRRRIDDLLQPITQALRAQECAVQPNKEVVALLEDGKAQATTILGTYRDHRTRLDSIVARANTAGTSAAVTLGKALDDLHDACAAEKNATIARAVQEQRQRDAEKMAEIERAKVQQEEELSREKAEKERLISLAKNPTIQSIYSPFLAKGRVHPHFFGYRGSTVPQWTFRHSDGPSKTVRYREIQDWRMLTNIKDFLAMATGAENDRPTWPYPVSDQQWQEYQKRFELFKQLAPVWLELGMLDP